jgi:hypothetical protein
MCKCSEAVNCSFYGYSLAGDDDLELECIGFRQPLGECVGDR